MSIRDQMNVDLQTVVFGDDADTGTFYPAGGATYLIKGWFHSAPTDVDIGAYAPVSSYSPSFTVQTSAIIGGLKRADEIVLFGVRYTIKQGKPDGRGTTELELLRK